MSKLALVLGGGGIRGGVYEVGCIKALEDILNVSVNDFKIFTGISAGSIVAGCLANGMPPEYLIESLLLKHEKDENLDLRNVFSLNPEVHHFIKKLLMTPILFPRFASRAVVGLKKNEDLSLYEEAYNFISSYVPKSLMLFDKMENFLENMTKKDGRVNHLDELDCDLILSAADINDLRTRTLFVSSAVKKHIEGLGINAHFNDILVAGVKISDAIAASCAVPFVYTPKEINGKYYVDGAVASTVNFTIVEERGANFMFILNPMAPNPNVKAEKLNGFDVLEQVGRGILTRRLQMRLGFNKIYGKVPNILIEPSKKGENIYYNCMLPGKLFGALSEGYRRTLNLFEENFGDYERQLGHLGVNISLERAVKIRKYTQRQDIENFLCDQD